MWCQLLINHSVLQMLESFSAATSWSTTPGGGGGGGISVRVTERENVNVARSGAMVGGQWCYLCVVCVAQVYAFAVLLNACILTRGNPPTPPPTRITLYANRTS